MAVSYGGNAPPMHVTRNENNREACFSHFRQCLGDKTKVAVIRHQVISDLALPFAGCGVEQRSPGNEQRDAALSYNLGYPVLELFPGSRRQYSSPTGVALRPSVR